MAKGLLKKLALGMASGLAFLSLYSGICRPSPSVSLTPDELEEMTDRIGEEREKETTAPETATYSTYPETKPLESIIDTSVFRIIDTSTIPAFRSYAESPTYSETSVPPKLPVVPEPEYSSPEKIEIKESSPALIDILPEKKSFLSTQPITIETQALPETPVLPSQIIFKLEDTLTYFLKQDKNADTLAPETRIIRTTAPEPKYTSLLEFEEKFPSISLIAPEKKAFSLKEIKIKIPQPFFYKRPEIRFETYKKCLEKILRNEKYKETETINAKFEIKTPLELKIPSPYELFETFILQAGKKEIKEIKKEAKKETEIIIEKENASFKPAIIIAYHNFDNKEGSKYSVRPENFRRHLEALWKNKFSTVLLSDYIKGTALIPKDEKPVGITIDEGNQSQFDYVFDSKTDKWVLNPNCAFAILVDFGKKHPEFGCHATFFIDSGDIPFGQEQFVKKKLEEILAAGMEIQNPKEVGKSMTYNGRDYENKAIDYYEGFTTCPSPFSKKFNPRKIPRIEAPGNKGSVTIEEIIGLANDAIADSKQKAEVDTFSLCDTPNIRITIDKSERKASIYQGGQFETECLIGIGKGKVGNKNFETPEGIYKITDVIYHPAWGHKIAYWMSPAQKAYISEHGHAIPYGHPLNPLRHYWISLSRVEIRNGKEYLIPVGFGLHGTSEDDSFGRMISHMCNRFPDTVILSEGKILFNLYNHLHIKESYVKIKK